jgi:hypothetical protein
MDKVSTQKIKIEHHPVPRLWVVRGLAIHARVLASCFLEGGIRHFALDVLSRRAFQFADALIEILTGPLFGGNEKPRTISGAFACSRLD